LYNPILPIVKLKIVNLRFEGESGGKNSFSGCFAGPSGLSKIAGFSWVTSIPSRLTIGCIRLLVDMCFGNLKLPPLSVNLDWPEKNKKM
jgi:hypothetical protein